MRGDRGVLRPTAYNKRPMRVHRASAAVKLEPWLSEALKGE